MSDQRFLEVATDLCLERVWRAHMLPVLRHFLRNNTPPGHPPRSGIGLRPPLKTLVRQVTIFVLAPGYWTAGERYLVKLVPKALVQLDGIR